MIYVGFLLCLVEWLSPTDRGLQGYTRLQREVILTLLNGSAPLIGDCKGLDQLVKLLKPGLIGDCKGGARGAGRAHGGRLNGSAPLVGDCKTPASSPGSPPRTLNYSSPWVGDCKHQHLQACCPPP